MKKVILLFIASLFFISCSTRTPYTNRSQLIMLNQSQEFALGAKTAQEIKKKEAKYLDKDYKALQRVRRVGWKIAQATSRKDFKWEFHVISKPILNAFCLPGGKVFVYKGIIDLTKGNDDELATVLSHEIAHALLRHSAERISMSQLQGLGSVLLDAFISVKAPKYRNLSRNLYGIGSQLGIMLPYSRKQELEADLVGLKLMQKAGFNPKAALYFWQKMAKLSKNKNRNDFFSTHPNDIKRIEQIKKYIRENTK